MSTEKPLVSVIIPHRDNETIEATLRVLETAADFSRESGHPEAARYEVIAVSGNQPSVQRNAAVREAAGQYIYFLDNDSIPAQDCFMRIGSFFLTHPNAAILGGPSLTPDTDTSSQKAFGHVLGSFAGTAFIRARYSSFGALRETTDRELILCNMAMRRQVFLDLGGFDERLYPNEENALMDTARAEGWTLWHDPFLRVWRSQRPSFRAFIRQLFGYGRGRAEQMRLAPLASNIVPFVFMLFPLAVLLLAPTIVLFPDLAWAWTAYPVLSLAASLPSLRAGFRVGAKSWLGFFLCHFCYGCGLWAGLVLPLRSRTVVARISLQRIVPEKARRTK